MKLTGFDVTPLSPLLGVRISGADLRRKLSAEQVATLHRLMQCHYLLVFRDQALTPEDQVRIVSLFGQVAGASSDGPLHTVVAAREGDIIQFHSDYSFTPSPLPFVSLYGIEVEGEVAMTAFVSGVAACAQLPAALRERIANRTVLHASDILRGGQRSTGPLRYDIALRTPGAFCGAHHPALLCHPITGDEVLFVNEYFSVTVDALAEDESDAVLQALFAHLYAPQRQYHHHWRTGDLLIFDNIALQHSRTSGPQRTLCRVIASPRPLAALFT